MKTPDMRYYGLPGYRFPSREAWRGCEQSWEPPHGPKPTPQLRIDDEREHPVTTRHTTPGRDNMLPPNRTVRAHPFCVVSRTQEPPNAN